MITRFRNILLIIILAIAAAANATVYTPEMMVNPNIANRYEFVLDPAHLLDDTTVQGVNQRLYDLRKTTTCEVAVIVVPDIGDTPIEDWCEEVFTDWGIGKSDKDNGALFVIAVEQHQARIQTGYGVEGVLTDIACNNIIGRAVIPNMREDNINAAVDDATALMYDALTDPSVAEELRSEQPDNYAGNITALSGDVIWKFAQYVALMAFMMCLAMFCYDLWTSRKLDPYRRSQLWRSHLKVYIIAAIFSLGSGLIFWFIALALYRTARTRPRKCPTCGAKMKRLGEEEDNELLNPSQDFEEKIKTVDYDVWECPECHTIERFPFKADQKRFSECPQCHTIAMCLVSDTCRIQPTTKREGLGEKEYECQFCHYRHRKPYSIPRKADSTAAAMAAGAILGSMGRGGGGGGGFGGGFGGGSTGGGGATGSW